MSASERMRRVNEAMREVLSEAMHGLKDPRIGFVTVTSVDTSSDLRSATVWVSILGSETERKLSLAGLRSAHGILQRKISNELRLKHTPQLDFTYDDTADRAQRVEEILRNASAGAADE